MVPRNNPASDLRIIHYLAGTGFAQSLVPQQVVVVATLAETAYGTHPRVTGPSIEYKGRLHTLYTRLFRGKFLPVTQSRTPKVK